MILTEERQLRAGPSTYSSSSSYPSRSLFTPSSINPDTFSPSFDIVWAINNDKERYVGDKNLTLYNYSPACKVNIDRLRPYLKGSPGVHPILSACLYGGISALSTYEGIRELTDLKLRFDYAPRDTPGTVSLALANFLHNFTIDVPKGKKLNIFIPLEHCGMLNRVAGDIGLAAHSLAMIGIYYTLEKQLQTNEDDRKEMGKVLESFYSAVDVRVRGAKALMKEFGIPEVKGKSRERQGVAK